MPISTIVVGRTDMACSLGINDVNGDDILEICNSIIVLASRQGIETIIGGGIDRKSIDFMRKLVKNGLDKFETRKCVFKGIGI